MDFPAALRVFGLDKRTGCTAAMLTIHFRDGADQNIWKNLGCRLIQKNESCFCQHICRETYYIYERIPYCSFQLRRGGADRTSRGCTTKRMVECLVVAQND